MQTPTNAPKAEKRRRTDRSPMYPASRNLDDESSEGMVFGPSDAPSNTTDGTTTAPGLNTSPEIVEAVRSFDALLASQNDTLGSLMDTPSGALTPAGFDDDFLQMEELQLQRYSDQLRQELNTLAPRQGISARHRSPVTTPQRSPVPRPLRTPPPMATVPSQDEEDDHLGPDVADTSAYYHDAATSLNLSASPIVPSGSNVNTPASHLSSAASPVTGILLPQRQPSPDRNAALPSPSPLRPTPATPQRTRERPPPSSSSSSSSGRQQQDTTTSSSGGGTTTTDSSAMTVVFVDKNDSASDSDIVTVVGAPSPEDRGERGSEMSQIVREPVDPSLATDTSTILDSQFRSAHKATFLAKGVLVPSPGSGRRSKSSISALPVSVSSEVGVPPVSSEEVLVSSHGTGPPAMTMAALDPTRQQDAAPSIPASPVRRNLFREEDSKPALSSFRPAQVRTLITGAMSRSGLETEALRPPPAPPLEDEHAEVPTSPASISGDSTGILPASTSQATAVPAPDTASSAAQLSPSSLSPDVIRTATALGLLGDNDEEEGSTGDENDPRTFPIPPLASGSSDLDHVSGAWIAPAPSTGSSTSRDEESGGHHHRDLLSTTLTTAPTATTTFDSADQVDDSDLQERAVARDSRAMKFPLHPTPPADGKAKYDYRQHGKGPKEATEIGAAAAMAKDTVIQPSPTQDFGDKSNDTDSDCLTRRRRCEFRLGTVILLLVLFISLVVLVVATVVLTNERNSQSAISPSLPPMTPSVTPHMVPSPSPISRRPTLRPISTIAPSESSVTQSLFEYLVSISSDSGAALRNVTSPQHQAFVWLSNNQDLSSYSPVRLRQRYTLATFYYSTNGDRWDVRTNWMTNENECKWFSRALYTTVCGQDSEFQRLELSYNNLDGPIPPELSLLSDTLQNMSLSGGPTGYLSGTIPTELGKLTNLWNLRLWNNRLSGPIPSELGQLTTLQYLDLSLNLLTGRISTEMGCLTQMAWLDFSVNRLSGRIPLELGNFSNLMFLDLSSNGLTGNVPQTFGNLTNLITLNLDNNRLQRINSNVGTMSSLESLSLANNALSGTIPNSIGGLLNLQRLNLTHNQLNGTLPSSMGGLSMLSDGLDLSHNLLVGTIPSWLGSSLSLLRILLLNDNGFNGTVPDSFALLGNLNVLRLDSTDLTGSVPSEVCGTFNETHPTLFADCEEINCPCCTYCCNDDSGCTCVHEGTLDDWKCYYY